MPERRSTSRTSRRAREARFTGSPVGAFFGFVTGPRDTRRARVTLAPRRELLQGHEHVHGGVIAALADTAGAWLFYPELERGLEMTSVEFKLNFLRPATLGAGELVATARPVKHGRTIALADVEVTQSGELVAKGLFTYFVFELATRGREDRSRVSSRNRSAKRSKG